MKPQEMQEAVIRNLPAKTGRSLEEWLAIAAGSGIDDRDALQVWLRDEHGLGPGQAKVLASQALHVPLYVPPALDETLAAQYAGAKADLLPIAQRVIEVVSGFGDTTVEARKTYVTFNRTKQFAAVGAPNRGAVAVDLKLKGLGADGRLALLPPGRGFSGNLTHRVLITSVTEVDDELEGWLRTAHESA